MIQSVVFVVFGEVLIDFICQFDGQWCVIFGGVCWNVVCVVVCLGVVIGYVGSVSIDVFGVELYVFIEVVGLDMCFIQQYVKVLLLVMVILIMLFDYFFIGDDSVDLYFDLQCLFVGWMDEVCVLYFGCISLICELLVLCLLQIVQEVVLCNKKIVFDFNWCKLMDSFFYCILFQ